MKYTHKQKLPGANRKILRCPYDPMTVCTLRINRNLVAPRGFPATARLLCEPFHSDTCWLYRAREDVCSVVNCVTQFFTEWEDSDV